MYVIDTERKLSVCVYIMNALYIFMYVYLQNMPSSYSQMGLAYFSSEITNFKRFY